MHSCHPVAIHATGVTFKGVDWAAEEEKSRKRQQKKERKKRRAMKDADICDFLRAAAAETEEGASLRAIPSAVPVIDRAQEQGTEVQSGGPSSANVVKTILDNFATAKKDEVLYAMLSLWLAYAKEEQMYTTAPPGSPSSKTSSSVSDLSSDIGLNPNVEPSLLDVYVDAVLHTLMKGVAMDLTREEAYDAVYAIFRDDGLGPYTTKAGVSFGRMSLEAMQDKLEAVEVERGGREVEEDTGKVANDHGTVHTVHTLASAKTHLHAFAMNYVSTKLSNSSDSNTVDAFVRRFFKNVNYQPR